MVKNIIEVNERNRIVCDVVSACLDVSDVEDVNNVLEEILVRYLPHSISCCCIRSQIDNNVLVCTKSNTASCFCEESFSEYTGAEQTQNELSDPGNTQVRILNNIGNVTDQSRKKVFVGSERVRNAMIYSLSDNFGKHVCRISLINNPDEWKQEHVILLDVIMPVMDSVLRRVDVRLSKGQGCNSAIPNLSKREIEILQCVLNEKTSAEVASILGISTNTVRNHIQNILNKLGVRTRTKAVAKAIRYGLIEIH